MNELLCSIMQSAEVNSLVHLNISDNRVGNDETLITLCQFIQNATCLLNLNISDLGITSRDAQLKVIQAVKDSQSAYSIERLYWNNDI